jgi:hypothetical protein
MKYGKRNRKSEVRSPKSEFGAGDAGLTGGGTFGVWGEDSAILLRTSDFGLRTSARALR